MLKVHFMGGNGHCAGRLKPAMRALGERSSTAFELVNVAYPGFEGRPRVGDLDTFLDHVGAEIAKDLTPLSCVYATGIGGLLFLLLREKGKLLDAKAILQGPVLWGLEHRWLPRVMRLGAAQKLLSHAFASQTFQDRFVAKHFRTPPAADVTKAFFDGYAACTALADFFAWLTPTVLRRLEGASREQLLRGVHFLWGSRDTVVPPSEIEWTRRALSVPIEVKTIATWGHYPMIDVPKAWIREVAHVAAAASLQ